MECAITLDTTSFSFPAASSRHSTSIGGYVDIVVSTLTDVTPGQHTVVVQCTTDTGGVTIGSTNLTVIATE